MSHIEHDVLKIYLEGIVLVKYEKKLQIVWIGEIPGKVYQRG